MKVKKIILLASALTLGTTEAFALGGCPADGNGASNKKITNLDLSVSASTGSTVTYTVDTPPSGGETGVPGLIQLCVYQPDNAESPNPVAPLFGEWLGGTFGENDFAFKRNRGNSTNVPFDGSAYVVGSATFSSDTPVERMVLLHINDPVECQSLYGGTVSTCFVKPKPATEDCPPGSLDPECTQNRDNNGSLSGAKYYDLNANGFRDGTEPGIENWQINISGLGVAITNNTVLGDNFSVTQVPAGQNYEVSEVLPTNYVGLPTEGSRPWIQTGNVTKQSTDLGGNSTSLENKTYSVYVAADGSTSGLNFGNVCLGGNGGGLTLGFWSNPNGARLYASTTENLDVGTRDWNMLNNLNLVMHNKAFSSDHTYFRKWILGATATNMAYMLSAQLAAMELNVFNRKVIGTSLIYAPGTNLGTNGFAAVQQVMDAANVELGQHTVVLDGSPYRNYQEALKNALDEANNNRNFLETNPALCDDPVFNAQ